MTDYIIEPVDTQFYRGNLPFDAGNDTYAATELLPSPRTVYGAFRAAGLPRAKRCMAIKKKSPQKESPSEPEPHPVLGSFASKGDLTVKGPVLFRKEYEITKYCLPMPADVVMQLERPRERLHFCIPDRQSCLGDGTDMELELKRLRVQGRNPSEKLEELLESHMLPHNLLGWYLLQQASMKRTKDSLLDIREKLFAAEPRVGMQREADTHAAKTGHLYAATHHRLRSVKVRGGDNYRSELMGYWVRLESSQAPNQIFGDEGALRLGGESRPARYQVAHESFPQDWMSEQKGNVVGMVAETGRFKLYLITPGLFGGTWHPFREQNKTIVWSGTIGQAKIIARLQAVAMAGSKYYGGWDIQKRQPKPLEKGVRAGTVYFFEIEEWEGRREEEKETIAGALYDHFNFRSLCACGTAAINQTDAAKEGFGIALMGGWDYVQNG